MLDEEKFYRIQWTPTRVLIGKPIRTRDNDESYPSFLLVVDGEVTSAQISTNINRVIGPVEKGDENASAGVS